MEKQLTVQELFDLCKKQIKQGNGNRKIVVGVDSPDLEAREYHGVFNGFFVPEGHEWDIYDSLRHTDTTELNQIIILE